MAHPFGNDKGWYVGLTNDKHETPIHYVVNGTPGEKNLMVWGSMGSGKDSGLITPNLSQRRTSIVIVDPKGEQCALTMRHRAKFSKIVVFNPYNLVRQ
jgi:type IV secretory pathway TraG/TraD family ATPase VirD4